MPNSNPYRISYEVQSILAFRPVTPSEGDYITEDMINFYQWNRLSVSVPGSFNWKQYLLKHMRIDKFYSDIWYLNFKNIYILLNVYE